MKRILELDREVLAALSDDELGGVAGAQAEYSGQGLTCPLLQCVWEFTVYPRCR